MWEFLDELLTRPIGAISVALGIWATILAFFRKVEELSPREKREDIAVWLLCVDIPRSVDDWPKQVASQIDRVFGTNQFSLKFILRSCFASLITVTVFTLIWLVARSDEYRVVLNHFRGSELLSTMDIITTALIMNFFPDYFSLLVTRRILRSVEIVQGKFKRLLLILLDAIASVVVLLTAWIVYKLLSGILLLALMLSSGQITTDIFNNIVDGTVYQITESIKTILILGPQLTIRITESNVFYPMGVLFYSTFFTSIWLWLYFLSGIVVRVLSRSRKIIRVLQDWLDIENHPLQTMGVVAGGLVALLILVVSLLF